MIYELIWQKQKRNRFIKKIVLRSVRGKVGNVVKIQPCKDPETSEYADCVKEQILMEI